MKDLISLILFPSTLSIWENIEMKILLFIFIATIVSTFQASVRPQEAPDLVVQNYEWGALRRTSFTQPVDHTADRSGRPEDRLPEEAIPRSEMDPRSGRRGETTQQEITRQETYALVKNVGVKTTKAVDWEYIFFSDADEQKELKRYQFHTKIKIAPGDIKFLSKDVNQKAASKRQKVNITRIEYTDGSVWQRAESK